MVVSRIVVGIMVLVVSRIGVVVGRMVVVEWWW